MRQAGQGAGQRARRADILGKNGELEWRAGRARHAVRSGGKPLQQRKGQGRQLAGTKRSHLTVSAGHGVGTNSHIPALAAWPQPPASHSSSSSWARITSTASSTSRLRLCSRMSAGGPAKHGYLQWVAGTFAASRSWLTAWDQQHAHGCTKSTHNPNCHLQDARPAARPPSCHPPVLGFFCTGPRSSSRSRDQSV